MTPKLIQLTNLPRVMLVMVPEGAHGFDIVGKDDNPILSLDHLIFTCDPGDGFYYHDAISLPHGNWRIVSKLSEVTEEWCKGVVDNSIHTGLSAHYTKGVNPPNVYCYKNSLESFHSAIEAEGWLLKSPPDPKCGCSGPAELGICEACDERMEAQQKVISPEHTLILEMA